MKTKEVELVIESYSRKGFGVGFFAKKKVEIPNALVGDTALVSLKARGKKGRVLSIVKAAKSRVEPRCKHVGMCGGCTWQEMDYDAQIMEKEALIQRCFSSFQTEFYPIIPCHHPWQYRNKMEFSFSENAAKTKYLGLMISGAPGYVFNVEVCHLARGWMAETVGNVRAWWEKSNLQAYQMRDDAGHLRTLTLREGMNTGEKMAVLTVSGNKEYLLSKNDLQGFQAAVGNDIQSFLRLQTIQKGSPTTFTTFPLQEKDHIVETLSVFDQVLRFRISPSSFFQPNTKQAEILYRTAIGYLEGPLETVYDLYSGTGTLGMLASSRASFVIGIEQNEQAVEDAKRNALENCIENISFLSGDVGKVITNLLSDPKFRRPDAVIVDPPRAGLDLLALHHIKTLLPRQILYISCNPITQAQNIEELVKAGYSLKLIQPIDQFPHTYHIENIALLTLS